jgi:hypothetical protein
MGFLRFWRPGGRGVDGEEQWSQQAQNQARLFGLRSLWRRFRKRQFTLCLQLRRAIALPVHAIGLLRDYLRVSRDRRRLRALERICLEQARLCNLPEAKAAFEEVARNYRCPQIAG